MMPREIVSQENMLYLRSKNLLCNNFQIQYPNPTKDILSVGISGVSEECTINLSLYDSQGALLQNITASPEESPIKINMASYLANWYILKVSIKEKNKFFKIIKQ